MKIDVFKGREFRPYFEHVSSGRDEGAHECRRIAVVAGKREDQHTALDCGGWIESACGREMRGGLACDACDHPARSQALAQHSGAVERQQPRMKNRYARSEEHTSELQSQ